MKAVLLDIGGVIVPYNYGNAYNALAGVCGLDPHVVSRVIADSALYPQLESGKLAPEEFASSVCRLLRCHMTPDEFYRLWCSIFLPGPLVTARTLAKLARSFRVVAVSDTNLIHFPYIRDRYPELEHFHAFTLSFEVKDVKPSEAMFRRALELADCQPHECIFIDDVQRNVDGARKLRIPANRFEGGAKLDGFLLRLCSGEP
jgi:FMN phosphatase YigB (HAD superfamily)